MGNTTIYVEKPSKNTFLEKDKLNLLSNHVDCIQQIPSINNNDKSCFSRGVKPSDFQDSRGKSAGFDNYPHPGLAPGVLSRSFGQG